jgi:superfamily II DNA or RNA helicase
MSDTKLPSVTPTSTSEAIETLVDLAGRKTLPIPALLLAEHVMGLPGPWDWPVRRAAFEATLRRLASAKTQELSISDRPTGGPFGNYFLSSPQIDGPLPYLVRLYGLSPLRARCDCMDFLRGALGLCKHVLAVLMALASSPRGWQRACATQALRLPWLTWDGTLSPAGFFDPLAAIGLDGGQTGRAGSSVRHRFSPGTRGVVRLADTYLKQPEARLSLVKILERAILRARASADPAAIAVLAEERGRLPRVLRLAAAGKRLSAASAHGKRTLYDYQKEGVARFLAEGRLVLADDMGLGKTTQAIVAAAALFETGLVRRGLFVVPASLKPQWEREWHATSEAPLRVVDGTVEQRREIYAGTKRGFLVTNYEQVMRDVQAIGDFAPELIVLDEAQRIKNWSTRTALTIKQLRPTYRLVLTGTPMENRLDELASIVEWVDDRALEPKWRLHPLHTALADGTREVKGARHLAALRARLAPVLLRRVRSEVLDQLPARQDTVIPVSLTDEQRRAHADLDLPIARLAAMARRRPLTPEQFLRLMSLLATQRVISNGMAQLNFLSVWPEIRERQPSAAVIASLDMPKLVEFRELIASLAVTQRRKVVVFSQWRRMLELAAWAVSDLLGEAGLRGAFFTGQEKLRRRTQNLVEFHDDPGAAVLFLSDAGGVGLNLQHAANACINLELPWNPAVLEQRIGRIHRLGQKRPIDVYNLVSQECIEERIAGIISDKRALFKGLFEGTGDEIAFDRSGNFLAVLERLVNVPKVEVPVAAAPAEEPEADAASSIEVENMVDAAAASATEPVAAESISPSALTGGAIVPLLGALKVERGADGSLRIEAPPAAAGALAALFEGMARLLSAAPSAPKTVAERPRSALPS